MLCTSINSIPIDQLSDKNNICTKEAICKHYYFYKNGIDKCEYFKDAFTIYITPQYFRMDSLLFNEIIIYDDPSGVISYLFTCITSMEIKSF